LAVNGKEVFKVEPLRQKALMNPYVEYVRSLEDDLLEVIFENGEHRIFDVKPYLRSGVFIRLRNLAVFKAARVVAGSVEWPGEIDLSNDTKAGRLPGCPPVTGWQPKAVLWALRTKLYRDMMYISAAVVEHRSRSRLASRQTVV